MADPSPAEVQSMLDMMSGLGARALQGVTGFDSAAMRFRNASGQFQSASSVMSGAFQGAMNKIGSAGKSAGDAVRSAGSAITSAMTGSVPSATSAASALGASLDTGITTAAHGAAEALSKLGPEGAAAGAAIEGLGTVVGATVGQLVSLMGIAVDVTQKMTLMRDSFAGLAGGAAGGKAVQDMIAGLNLPFATSQVNTWAAALVAAGVSGKQLAEETKAIASAAALSAVLPGAEAAAMNFFKRMGEGGAEADKFLQTLHKGGPKAAHMLKEMGLNMKDFGGEAAAAKMTAEEFTKAAAAALQKKGGSALADMFNTLPVILMKAQAGLRSLFSGVEKPAAEFMETVAKLFGEFSKGGVAINVLKPIVTTVFTALFHAATWAFDAIHKGFLLLVIGGLKVYIALRPAIEAIKSFATSSSMLTGLQAGLALIAVLAGLIALPFVLLGAGILIVIGIAVAFVAAFISAAGAVINFVTAGVSAAADFVSAFVDAPGQVIAGLVNGLLSGAGAVASAMGSLASGALATFEGIFKIGSPSKVMHEHGQKNIAEDALAEGIDKGGAKVDASMAKLGAGGPGTPAGGRGAGAGIMIGSMVVNINGAEGPASAWEEFVTNLQALRSEAPVPVGP